MSAVSEALLKGRRGIAIDHAKASVADIIRNEVGLQGMSMLELAMLAKIERERIYYILSGEVSVSEYELKNIEAALGIEIDRSRLTPTKYKLC